MYKPSSPETAIVPAGTPLYTELRGLNSTTLEVESQLKIKNYHLVKIKKETIVFAEVSIHKETYYLKASDFSLIHTNPINAYISDQLQYPKLQISDQLQTIFRQRAYKTETGLPKGVIIHETGIEGSTIDDEMAYMIGAHKKEGVFVHAFIDQDQIVRIADEDYMAQGAGAQGNQVFLQFEMNRVTELDDFANQVANAAFYTAWNLKQYGLEVTVGKKNGSGTVWSHEMISLYLGGTDHVDPVEYWTSRAEMHFGTDYGIKDFTALVQAYYNQL